MKNEKQMEKLKLTNDKKRNRLKKEKKKKI